MPARTKLFISYSHKDQKLFDEFMAMLAPAERAGLIDPWVDTRLAPGQNWQREILRALDSCRIGVLLVSEHALASPFITEYELPRLLGAAEHKGLRFFWVYLRPCPDKAIEKTGLKAIQAINPKPMSSYRDPSRRAEEWKLIADHLLALCSPPGGRRTPWPPPDTAFTQLGLADIALDRAELSWPPAKTRGVADLFERVRRNGELFIVARSLEAWYTPTNHLPRLAELIVERNLHCTIAIPHPYKRIRSLVADDPSQNFKLRLWDEIRDNLAAVMERTRRDREGNSGRLEIYGIPAYVPSTFLLTTVADSVDYCALEVGIGVPPRQPGTPGKPRVHLVFKKQPRAELTRQDGQDLFRAMASIYRGILKERVPLLRLPGVPDVIPESDGDLTGRYDEIVKGLLLQEATIDTNNLRENTDLCDGDAKPFHGQAVCVGTLPIRHYFGFRETAELIHKVRQSIEDFVWPHDPHRCKFTWLDANTIFLPVFWYKRSFYEPFVQTVEETRLFHEMRESLQNCTAFSIEFTRVIVDHNGIVYLGGFERSVAADRSATPSLTAIRDTLDVLCDLPYARHTPKRPLDILLPIGHLAGRTLTSDETVALKRCVRQHFMSHQTPATLHVDRLRMVTVSGGLPPSSITDVNDFSRVYLQKSSGWLRYLVEGNTGDNVDDVSSYGVLSPRKWLAHEEVVRCVKEGCFSDIPPITVQISPTLRCTNRCPICSYGETKEPLLAASASGKNSSPQGRSTAVEMSPNDMMRTIHRLGQAGVKGVIFTGGGEPLMSPFTLEGMLYARRRVFYDHPDSRDARHRDKWLSVGLFTNGQLLDRNDGIDRIARDIDPTFVRVSMNAGNAQVYALIHGTRGSDEEVTFNHVLANISRLAEARQRYNATFKLDVAVLVTPLILDNLLDLSFELKRIAFRYPGMLNGVVVRPAVRYGGGCWNREGAEECVRYLEDTSRSAICRGLADSFREFVTRGVQFPNAVFEAAEAIVNQQVRPILAAGVAESDRIHISVPRQRFSDVGRPVLGSDSRQCLAAPLVAFVGPDTSLYHCVERALDPGMCYGKLSELGEDTEDEVRRFFADGRRRALGFSHSECPPICLLHECNALFAEVTSRLRNDRERTEYEIDVAREYFKDKIEPKLGKEIVNFI